MAGLSEAEQTQPTRYYNTTNWLKDPLPSQGLCEWFGVGVAIPADGIWPEDPEKSTYRFIPNLATVAPTLIRFCPQLHHHHHHHHIQSQGKNTR